MQSFGAGVRPHPRQSYSTAWTNLGSHGPDVGPSTFQHPVKKVLEARVLSFSVFSSLSCLLQVFMFAFYTSGLSRRGRELPRQGETGPTASLSVDRSFRQPLAGNPAVPTDSASTSLRGRFGCSVLSHGPFVPVPVSHVLVTTCLQ